MAPARLGQHFLVDPSIAGGIVSAAVLAPGERVLEIGPGRGMLTEGLLETGAAVTAVEMDDRLAALLRERWADRSNFKLIHSDFLKLDLETLGEGPFKVVANLPYSVASPILQKILTWPRWTLAVLMFQKEVAERIVAAPGGPDYGLLTLSAAIHAETEYLLDVPRECFSPRPKVASSVIRLQRRRTPLLDAAGEEAFFRIARAAFSQRRKMAANPLAQALELPRETVVAALSRCGVPATARPEEIPVEAWLKLPAELSRP